MANIFKDEAGHFTSKENDGGPCRHKRISNGKYEKSEDGGKTWTPFNSRKEYDEYDGESWEFDSDDEEEPNPMNEFSGPDREGPSFSQLDFIDDNELKKYADRYELNIDDLKSEIIKRYKENDMGMSEKDAIRAHQENLIEELVENNGKLSNKPDATTYNGAEVIGGDDDNEGILKDETPLTEEESKKLDSGTLEFIDNIAKKNSINEENYQKLKKQLIDTFSEILKKTR